MKKVVSIELEEVNNFHFFSFASLKRTKAAFEKGRLSAKRSIMIFVSTNNCSLAMLLDSQVSRFLFQVNY